MGRLAHSTSLSNITHLLDYCCCSTVAFTHHNSLTLYVVLAIHKPPLLRPFKLRNLKLLLILRPIDSLGSVTHNMLLWGSTSTPLLLNVYDSVYSVYTKWHAYAISNKYIFNANFNVLWMVGCWLYVVCHAVQCPFKYYMYTYNINSYLKQLKYFGSNEKMLLLLLLLL